MSQRKDSFIYQYKCKNCGNDFYITENALETTLALGLSSFYHCQKCRKNKIKDANKTGLSYWSIPAKTDFTSRSLEEVGLGKLDRQIHPNKRIEYKPQKNIADGFKILQPAVNQLIENLIDPHGSRVSIFIAPTGTGKSVWVTSEILKSSIGREGKIIVTQPRTITLRAENKNVEETTPGYIATQILGAPGVGIGQEVGYAYRGSHKSYDESTKLLFVTDGLLIQWILKGKIDQYSVIIIDEAHEQSSNMEQIFALLRYKLPLYPYLRIVIMSATLDPGKFQTYFQSFGCGNPKTVPVFKPDDTHSISLVKKVYDRWYPTDTYDDDDDFYSPIFSLPQNEKDTPEVIAKMITAIRTEKGFTKLEKKEGKGDILVFVPTIELIKDTKEAIKNTLEESDDFNINILLCHAQMNKEESKVLKESEVIAEEAFKNGKETYPQRVILATNYAETSITLSNLCFIIDSGYILQSRWNNKACTKIFELSRHSQSGCTQRKGRVGRRRKGEVFRLYTKKQFKDFRSTPLPEVARTNLDMFLLKVAAAGIGDLEHFNWLGFDDDETKQDQILEKKRAIKTLKKRGAIDEKGNITPLGMQLYQIEVSNIDIALFLYESDRFGCALEVATFLAFLENNYKYISFEKNKQGLLNYALWSAGCYDDLEYYLRLYYYGEQLQNDNKSNYNKQKTDWVKNGFSQNTFEKIQTKRDELLEQLNFKKDKYIKHRPLDLNRLDRVRLLLIKCIPEWIYVKDDLNKNKNLFVPHDTENCFCTDPVSISEHSCCLLENDVEAFVCIERASTKKNKLFARHIVRITLDWLPDNWLPKLQTSGIISTSMIMKNYIENDNRKLCETTSERIVNLLQWKVSHHNYVKGEEKKFRVVRSQKANRKIREQNFLVYDLDSEKFVIVRFRKRERYMISGTIFRAYIEEIKDNNILILSQWKFYQEEGTIIKQRKIEELGEDKYEVDIEPGLIGILRTKKLGKSKKWIEQINSGSLRLQILESTEKEIKLEPSLDLLKGKKYDAHIIDFCYGEKEKIITYIRIETIQPNLKGRISTNETIDSTTYQMGNKLSVIFYEERDGELIFEIAKTYSQRKPAIKFLRFYKHLNTRLNACICIILFIIIFSIIIFQHHRSRDQKETFLPEGVTMIL